MNRKDLNIQFHSYGRVSYWSWQEDSIRFTLVMEIIYLAVHLHISDGLF